MAPTSTFRDEYFEFFSEEPATRVSALRSEIKQCLASLWDAVEREVGPDRFRKEFGQWRVGDLGQGADHAWAQTNDDARPRFDLPNLTIEINSHELSLGRRQH